MATALAADELLAEARLPILPARTRVSALPNSPAAPGILRWRWRLAVLRIEDGVISAPRLGVGGAEATPRRIAAAEAVLRGERPGEALFREAAAVAAAAIDPLEDAQTDAQYRRELVAAMVRRALTQACGRGA